MAEVSRSALIGLLLAAALWNVGLVAMLPAAVMASLLGLTPVVGLRALVAKRRSPAASPLLGRLAGALTVGSAAVYLASFFAIGDGGVPVTRRVAEPAAEVAQLRLVDFNVLHGYPRFAGQEERYGKLLAALAALDPTVIVLQEAWSVVGHGALAQRLGADLGLDVAYARANGSRRLLGFEEGSAVLSRLPIVSARRLVLAPRRPFWEARVALVVELATGPGTTLPVVATHLSNRGGELAFRQARDLAARLAGELTIVAGDLNAPSGSAAVGVFEALGLVDAVPGGIDHVLVHGEAPWRVERAGWTLRPQELAALIGEEIEISDHPGIVVDLRRVLRL
jgi:endonuclease/exonuclease/phosphatase (EEP) superfamily protein YafD